MEELKNILYNNKPIININGRICHHRIKILYALVEKYKLKKYLEIGVHNGSSMSYVLKSSYIKKCYGIDPFEDLKTNDGSMKHYQEKDKITMTKTLINLNNNNYNNADIKLFKDYSNNIDLLKIDNDIDIIFIDGDHSYNATKNDYYKFKKVVKSGGFIVFDDLHQDGPKKVFFEILKNDKDIKLYGIYEKTEGILIKK
jgi:predicted O-methyltransferase YrrM